MEPPSPLISWVDPFPSRFINSTACFPRKVSYFCESRMSPWKEIKLDEVELRSPSFDCFPFLLYVHFYNFTAVGIWVSWDKSQWITRLRLSMKRWDKGSELRITERFFGSVSMHVSEHAPWKESTIKRPVDDLELFDDQRRKSARIIWFLSSPWSGFRVQKRWPK